MGAFGVNPVARWDRMRYEYFHLHCSRLLGKTHSESFHPANLFMAADSFRTSLQSYAMRFS
jgi:hypothetical protein